MEIFKIWISSGISSYYRGLLDPLVKTELENSSQMENSIDFNCQVCVKYLFLVLKINKM